MNKRLCNFIRGGVIRFKIIQSVFHAVKIYDRAVHVKVDSHLEYSPFFQHSNYIKFFIKSQLFFAIILYIIAAGPENISYIFWRKNMLPPAQTTGGSGFSYLTKVRFFFIPYLAREKYALRLTTSRLTEPSSTS